MQYIKGLDAFDGRNHTAVTLGKFDGLHRGHQKLLNRIMKYAQKEKDLEECVMNTDVGIVPHFINKHFHPDGCTHKYFGNEGV